MFLSKAFSMSEMEIHQILKFSRAKNFKSDVDAGCIIFKLYRRTESSIILLKRRKENTKKMSHARFLNNVFI